MRIGLTGGIASGKSTVSTMITELGIPVVDADIVAREVVVPGQQAYDQIIFLFGNQILQDDGSINRKKLGSIIFGNDEKRQQLNQIVHPAVRKRMLELVEKYEQLGHELVVLDVPLLFESDFSSLVEKTIVVYVEEKIQKERLMKRDQFSDHEAVQRINAQMPLKRKKELADKVINNNGSIEQTKEQLIEILKEWNVYQAI